MIDWLIVSIQHLSKLIINIILCDYDYRGFYSQRGFILAAHEGAAKFGNVV